MDKKKEEVYQHLIHHTAKQLQQHGSLGRDALKMCIRDRVCNIRPV